MFIHVMYDFLRALQNDTCSISENTFVICNVQSRIEVVNCNFFFLPWKACSFPWHPQCWQWIEHTTASQLVLYAVYLIEQTCKKAKGIQGHIEGLNKHNFILYKLHFLDHPVKQFTCLPTSFVKQSLQWTEIVFHPVFQLATRGMEKYFACTISVLDTANFVSVEKWTFPCLVSPFLALTWLQWH